MSEAQNPAPPRAESVHRIEIASARESGNGAADLAYQRMSPEQFTARLSEAEEAGKRRLLKELGFKKDDRAAVMADIAAGRLSLTPKPKEGEPDYRAEYEKLKGVSAENELLKQRVAKATERDKKLAEAEFAKLPEWAQKIVAAQSGDDPEKVIAAIDAIRASGAPLAAADAAPAPGTAPKPATTGTAGGPTPVGPNNSKTAYQKWEELKAIDPMLGSQFYRANEAAVKASRPK